MGATINGRVELIQLLVDNGAVLSLRNNVSLSCGGPESTQGSLFGQNTFQEGKTAADFAKMDEIKALVEVDGVAKSEGAPGKAA